MNSDTLLEMEGMQSFDDFINKNSLIVKGEVPVNSKDNDVNEKNVNQMKNDFNAFGFDVTIETADRNTLKFTLKNSDEVWESELRLTQVYVVQQENGQEITVVKLSSGMMLAAPSTRTFMAPVQQ